MIKLTSIRTVLLPMSLIATVSSPAFALKTTPSARSLADTSLLSAATLSTKGIDRSGCLEGYINGDSIDVPNLIDTSSACYELRLNGIPVSLQKGWSLKDAIADLEFQKHNYPNAFVEGYYGGFKIGYELYWNGIRVGYEPSWSLEQARANLEWNEASYTDRTVEGYFYGLKMPTSR